MTTEELLRIAVAVYLLKQKSEVLPKSNSAFYLLKEQDLGELQSLEYPEVHSEVPQTSR